MARLERSTRRALLRTGVRTALLGTLFLTTNAWAQCQKDTDCKGDRVCEEGRCVASPAPLTQAVAPTVPVVIPPPVLTPPPLTAPPVAGPDTPVQPANPVVATIAPPRDAPEGPGSGKLSHSLLVGGVVSLSVGYFIALVGGGITTGVATSQTNEYRATCLSSGPLNFIPLFGPILFAGNYPKHDVVGYGNGSPETYDCNGSQGIAVGVAVTSEVFQLAGVGMITAALILRHPPNVKVRQVGTLSLLPGTTSTPMGLTFQLSDL